MHKTRAQTYDIVICGGRVIDPANGIDTVNDVAVIGDRIAEVGPGLAAQGAKQLINAYGKIVTPGLIDMHVHVY